MPTVNIPSQLVVQTAAQWAADATVYSAKRILITSDSFYGATDQQKFKIADGTQTWAQLDYFPVSGFDDATSSIQTQINSKQASLGYTAENVANKDIDGTLAANSDIKYASQKATKTYVDASLVTAKSYADGLVVGLWDDRGNFDASVNAYPSSGGSGTAGTIKKGDTWTVSVAGTFPTAQSVEVGDIVRALIDTPGNTQANWAIQQNNIGYTAENSANKSTDVNTDQASSTKYPTVKAVYDWAVALFQTLANKDATGGYAGLTLFKINFKNVANTFTSFFTNSNTAARTYTFQDRNGTIADNTDLALKAPLASPALTGSPTAPTQSANDNSTKLASTAYVKTAMDAQLASYYTLRFSFVNVVATAGIGTYFTYTNSNQNVPAVPAAGAATSTIPAAIYIAAADYPSVNGLTPKLRIRANIFTNAAAPTGNFTFGLFPITAPGSAGGAGVRSHTIGTVVTGSDGATQAAPAANTNYNLVSSDFALPADGWYVVCITTTSNAAANSYSECTCDLQITYK